MKSKILALSKNEEFKNLLKQKKITNKYVSIFFGKLLNNPKFVAVSNKINEESLYNLIQNYFDKNDFLKIKQYT